jgi:hypothetical protein
MRELRPEVVVERDGDLALAGFVQVDGYGEDGEPLSPASRRMIAVARC